jgi:hypothetical protein
MRLHKQLSSFRLRILSNTPSYLEESHEWNTIVNPTGTGFLFCKSGLRNAWTNRYNSRQDCNLEELISQINQPSNKLHPRCTTLIARTQKSREVHQPSDRFFFLDKEWWRLEENVLRVHENPRMVYQDSKRHNRVQEGSTTTRCFLMVNGASMKMREGNPLNEV